MNLLLSPQTKWSKNLVNETHKSPLLQWLRLTFFTGKNRYTNLILKPITLIAIIAFATGCQKETLTVPSNSTELKTVDASGYNKIRNALAFRSENEKYCNTDYFYTDSIIINGVGWQYPSSGYENLMFKGLTHVTDASNDYFYCALEWPSNAYQYGIGFGTKTGGSGYYPFTANIQVSIPEKNYTINYSNASCFAIGDQSLALSTDSIRIILRKKQAHDVVVTPDTILSFAQMKDKLGLAVTLADSVALYSSLGRVASFNGADVYNWMYYNAGTSDVYGLENAGVFSYNLNFGEALTGGCSGAIDIYLHQGKTIYKCTTSYSIFYNNYTGCRKQLHIYQ